MALTPENETAFLDDYLAHAAQSETTLAVNPSKTWALDFDAGTIGATIDEDLALRQFIIKALMTARSRYLIYSDDYGNELFDLIGENVTPALLDSEIPRMVREALVYDDRVEDVTDIAYSRTGDELYVSFTVVRSNGDTNLTQEVVLGGV